MRRQSVLITFGLALLGHAAAAQVVEYYHLDAVGNVRVATDSSGNVMEQHDYLPFGEECTTGPCASNPGVAGGQTRKFTGKERDQETGYDYFGARYYGSKTGRFTAIDPVYTWKENLEDPQRWNRYAYGRNNPSRYMDPDGRDFGDYVTGVANAVGSNFMFGQGRTSGGNGDFQFGQFMGDVVSIPAGIAWGDAGATLAGAGLVGAPESGGTTLVASGAGVAIMVQGGTASLAGTAHAGVYLAKKLGGNGPSTAVTSGTARAPKKGAPNSIYEQVDDAGNVRSRTFYDSHGNAPTRQDFDHSHGGIQPHEHNRDFNAQGQPTSREQVSPVPKGYDKSKTNQ